MGGEVRGVGVGTSTVGVGIGRGGDSCERRWRIPAPLAAWRARWRRADLSPRPRRRSARGRALLRTAQTDQAIQWSIGRSVAGVGIRGRDGDYLQLLPLAEVNGGEPTALRVCCGALRVGELSRKLFWH